MHFIIYYQKSCKNAEIHLTELCGLCYAFLEIKQGVNRMSKENYSQVKIGEVYLMKFTGEGNEQNGWRPGLVFQNNTGNIYSPNVIALPLTSSIKKMGQPTHVLIPASKTGLRVDSVVLCENPQRMSKNNIGMFITTLSDDLMREVAIGSMLASSAISFMNKEDLMRVYKQAVKLNAA